MNVTARFIDSHNDIGSKSAKTNTRYRHINARTWITLKKQL